MTNIEKLNQSEEFQEVIHKFEEIAFQIQNEISFLSLENTDRNSSGFLKYLCRYIFDGQRLDVFSGSDFLYGGIFYDYVQYEDTCLQEGDISPNDILIKAGMFAGLVKEYLNEHNVNIGPKFFESNTYSHTHKLGVRVIPALTSTNMSSNDNSTKSTTPRHKFYVKFRESLEVLMVNIKRVASDSGIALRCKVPLMLSSYARSMNMSGSSGGFFNGIQQVTDHHVSSSSQAPRSAIATTTSAVPSSTNPGTVTPATSNEEFIMDLMQTLYERVERLESEVLAFRESRLMAPLSATAVPSSSNEAAKSSVPPSKRAKRNKN